MTDDLSRREWLARLSVPALGASVGSVVSVTGPRVLTPAAVFLQVEGAASGDITVDRGDVSKAAVPVAFASGAAKTAVRRRA